MDTKPSTLLDESSYTTRRGYLHACMMADAYLLDTNTDTERDELAEGKLRIHGRPPTEVGTYGDWRILRYPEVAPAFGSKDKAEGPMFTGNGPKGLSRGFDTLPELLAELREWDERCEHDLPDCTCP